MSTPSTQPSSTQFSTTVATEHLKLLRHMPKTASVQPRKSDPVRTAAQVLQWYEGGLADCEDRIAELEAEAQQLRQERKQYERALEALVSGDGVVQGTKAKQLQQANGRIRQLHQAKAEAKRNGDQDLAKQHQAELTAAYEARRSLPAPKAKAEELPECQGVAREQLRLQRQQREQDRLTKERAKAAKLLQDEDFTALLADLVTKAMDKPAPKETVAVAKPKTKPVAEAKDWPESAGVKVKAEARQALEQAMDDLALAREDGDPELIAYCQKLVEDAWKAV